MFFNRDDDQKKLWRQLAKKSILLLAPRRIGKTLLLNKLRETAGDNGFHAISLDVQDSRDEPHFINQFRRELVSSGLLNKKDQALLSDATNGILGLFGRVRKAKGFEFDKADANWQEKGDKLIEILSHYTEIKWLIQVDELALFIVKRILIAKGDGHTEDSKQRAFDFLSWLRKYQNTAKHPQLRWIFASSIGLDTIAERINASGVLNELNIYHLGAFTPPHDRNYLAKLCDDDEITMSEEVTDHFIERIGWPIPYYMDKLFLATMNAATGEQELLSTHVDQGFDDLLSPANKGYFNTWRQRLDDELSESHKQQALIILKHCAKDPQGASHDTLIQALNTLNPSAAENMTMLLSILCKDGYLIEDKQRMRFRLELLREYWLRSAL